MRTEACSARIQHITVEPTMQNTRLETESAFTDKNLSIVFRECQALGRSPDVVNVSKFHVAVSSIHKSRRENPKCEQPLQLALRQIRNLCTSKTRYIWACIVV